MIVYDITTKIANAFILETGWIIQSRKVNSCEESPRFVQSYHFVSPQKFLPNMIIQSGNDFHDLESRGYDHSGGRAIFNFSHGKGSFFCYQDNSDRRFDLLVNSNYQHEVLDRSIDLLEQIYGSFSVLAFDNWTKQIKVLRFEEQVVKAVNSYDGNTILICHNDKARIVDA